MNIKSPAEQIALKQEPVSVTDDTATDTLDDFIERAMERIISKNIDREKLKIELASDWDELDKRGIQVIRNIKTILEDEGLPNDQIEWGFNFPSLSIQNAKRLPQHASSRASFKKKCTRWMRQSRCSCFSL